MDFMTNLLLCNEKNAVMTCIEGLLGYVCLIPCSMGEGELSAEHVAQLFFDSVIRVFGCQMKFCMTGILGLQQTAGGICGTAWVQGLCFQQHTIPKLMVRLNLPSVL